MERDEYYLGYRYAEQERLQRQAEELEKEARGLPIRSFFRPEPE